MTAFPIQVENSRWTHPIAFQGLRGVLLFLSEAVRALRLVEDVWRKFLALRHRTGVGGGAHMSPVVVAKPATLAGHRKENRTHGAVTVSENDAICAALIAYTSARVAGVSSLALLGSDFLWFVLQRMGARARRDNRRST